MSWIRVSTDLSRHPKAILLGRELGQPLAWAWMVELWAWMYDHADDGVISKELLDIAEMATSFSGKRGDLFAAATKVSFGKFRADGAWVAKNWFEFQGAAIREAKHNSAKRKREWRKRRSENVPGTNRGRVPEMSPTSHGLRNVTRRDVTLEESKDLKPSVAESATPPPVSRGDSGVSEIPAAPVEAVESTQPKPKRKPKPEKPPSPGFQPLKLALCEAYFQATGEAYAFQKGRDGKGIESLLRVPNFDESATVRRWLFALGRQGFERPRDILDFFGKWNLYAGAQKSRVAAGNGPPRANLNVGSHPAGVCTVCGSEGVEGGGEGDEWLCYPCLSRRLGGFEDRGAAHA